MTQFNTSNTNHFTFTTETLQFHVLGGLSTFGLDRLRVTLKVHRLDDEFHALRHNMDLYNANGVEKFVLKLAEFLEVGTSTIRRSLQELIAKLENYRLELLDQSEESEAEEYLLTKKERRSAMAFLKAKNLLEKTNTLIGKSGVIGEGNNRLLMYLIFTSRKMNNPLHCISFGSSGSGKTHLQSKVADLIPEEDRLSLTSLSSNSFYYFKREELKHKLILIEDLDGADDVLYPLRELQSKGKISKSVVQKSFGGQGKTKNLVVEGPVSVAGCTTKEKIYEDNSNRSFLLFIDESEVQDERIMHYQRSVSAGRIDIEEELSSEELLQNVQRLLHPIRVINPYAEHLILPKSVFKPRRTNAHYLQFIEAITFYHQCQRDKQYDIHTGEEYIETTIEDIKYANELLKHILLRKSDNLNGATRNYLERLKAYLEIKQDVIFTNREIRKEFRLAESTLRRYQLLLQQEGYIKRRTDIQSDSFSYEIVDINEFKDLEKSIEDALNFCLEKLEEPQISSSKIE